MEKTKFITGHYKNEDAVNVTMNGTVEEILSIFHHISGAVHHALLDIGLTNERATHILTSITQEGSDNLNIEEV